MHSAIFGRYVLSLLWNIIHLWDKEALIWSHEIFLVNVSMSKVGNKVALSFPGGTNCANCCLGLHSGFQWSSEKGALWKQLAWRTSSTCAGFSESWLISRESALHFKGIPIFILFNLIAGEKLEFANPSEKQRWHFFLLFWCLSFVCRECSWVGKKII